MDLTEILRKRTQADLDVAMVRALELSLEIENVARELRALREKAGAISNTAASSAPDVGELPGLVAFESSVGRPAIIKKKPLPYRKLLRKIYGRRTEKPRLHWHFDEIAGSFPPRDKSGVHVMIASTGAPTITLSGWVVPMDNDPVFNVVEIALIGQGGSITRETQTFQRPDVAVHFGNPAVASCGFRLEIPMFELRSGKYDIKIACRTANGTVTSVTAGTATIS